MNSNLNYRKNQFFASCPRGLESLLEAELLALGIESTTLVVGGVEFECKAPLAFKAMLYSTIASRVYMQLFDFNVKTEKDIYHEAKKFKWNSFFNQDQTFKVSTILGQSPNRSRRSQFKNSMYLGLQLKDAIVDRYRMDSKVRPNVNPDDADISFLMHVSPHDNIHSTKEKVIVSVDLCGEPLSNRGYRTERFDAPLRENLAAGILRMIRPDRNTPIIDGMTGSGTFIIEAAMMFANIPPSIIKVQQYLSKETNYPWNFLKMNFYTRDRFLEIEFNKLIAEVVESKERYLKSNLPIPYLAAIDINPEALEIAQRCMARAGVKGLIDTACTDIRTFVPPTDMQKGILFCNPPYGERMGENQDLGQLYYQIGENLKANFKGFEAYIFTGNMELLKHISLRTSSKQILFNGNIECRLARYSIY